MIPLRKLASELPRSREKYFRLMYRSCVSRAYFKRTSFLSFIIVVLFFVEADNMHGDVSTYFTLVYWKRELVLVMKRVKCQAMFRPSWKFEGKPNSIPPQFFVLCFRVFLEGLCFRGLRFLGDLAFRDVHFLWGSSFSRSSFSRGSSFSRSSFSRGSSFSRSSFSRGSSFSRSLFFLFEVFGLWSSFSRHPFV